jgi:hypothetical protein
MGELLDALNAADKGGAAPFEPTQSISDQWHGAQIKQFPPGSGMTP